MAEECLKPFPKVEYQQVFGEVKREVEFNALIKLLKAMQTPLNQNLASKDSS
jgi:hypothetical protein